MTDNLTDGERDLLRGYYAEATERGYDAASAKRQAEQRLADWRAAHRPESIKALAEWRERQAREAAALAERQRAYDDKLDALNAQEEAELAERERVETYATRRGLRIARPRL
jgi:hypothetical protein